MARTTAGPAKGSNHTSTNCDHLCRRVRSESRPMAQVAQMSNRTAGKSTAIQIIDLSILPRDSPAFRLQFPTRTFVIQEHWLVQTPTANLVQMRIERV